MVIQEGMLLKISSGFFIIYTDILEYLYTCSIRTISTLKLMGIFSCMRLLKLGKYRNVSTHALLLKVKSKSAPVTIKSSVLYMLVRSIFLLMYCRFPKVPSKKISVWVLIILKTFLN